MDQEEYLQRLHNEILEIMDFIHDFCKKNDIKYYLVGGTLLGAVRHKGFIPWDDDADIAMPRSDFNKFIELLNAENTYPYKLDWITTNPMYHNLFAKVKNETTVFQEKVIDPKLLTRGIFIDVFPLDLVHKNGSMVGFIKKIVMELRLVLVGAVRPQYNKRWKEKIAPILKNRFLRSCIHKSACKMMQFNIGSPRYYANYSSQYPIEKQTMPKEWYGDGKLLLFENRQYYVPSNYEKVLASIYGENYMQLPPENKRRTHYPLKVKFSDGVEVVFDDITESSI